MQVISIPSLDSSVADYGWLFETLKTVLDNKEGTLFRLSYCTSIAPSALAFLGGLVRLAAARGIRVEFDWASLRHIDVRRELKQNGFAVNFGDTSHGWSSDCIPYREDPKNDHNSILDYLTDRWIGRDWIKLSEKLRDAIVGHVWEIYANAFEHGQSSVGVFTCGEHCSIKNEVVLAVVDFGVGIPNKIRDFLKVDSRSDELRSSSLLSWAFKRGNTTDNSVARGLGLDLLTDLVQVNNGSLEIYSNNAYAIVNRDGRTFHDLDFGFTGTVVQIKLKCDERLYRFRDEAHS